MISNGRPMKEQHGLTSDGHHQEKRQFGNYDLIRRIDMGGMGEVYLAHQRTAFNREVAVKIIRDDLSRDPLARGRFFREAEVSSHLKHEHILPLFEFGEVQGRLFLATPYISGGTLAQRLHAGPLPLPEVEQLFAALVQAVAYIHRRGVVHRDLKPSNILLDREEVTEQVYVRLIDFGIATRSGASASPPLTTAGHEMGTLAYMAPERMNGIAAPSNDIFSLGVILYQMLTGRLPGGETPIGLATPLAAVVRGCMEPRPEERYASATEVLHAFEQACQALNTSAPQPTRPAPLPPPEMLAPMPSQPVYLDNAFEVHTLQDVGDVPTFAPVNKSTFEEADYAAQTMDIGHLQPGLGVSTLERPKSGTGNIPVVASGGKKSTRGRRRRKNPTIAIVSLLIVIVLLVMASMLFFSVPLVASANINISPQVHAFQHIYTITAQPSQTRINVATSSIPARAKTLSQTGSQTGQTTGQQCDLFVFECKQAVSIVDVQNVSSQLRQTLISQLSSNIDRQLQAAHATGVGQKQFADLSVTNNPAVGTVSKTVTVTLTEQGSVEYVNNADAQQVARSLMSQQVQKLGSHYVLMNGAVQVGQPVIEAVTDQGVVTMKVAAAASAEYQFPASQLTAIPNAIKGMSLANARAYLRQQPGVDANSISIHFTLGGGNTLPFIASQIRIIPINPMNLPSATLPVVPTPAVTPTNTTTPQTTPTTPPDN